MRLRDLLFAMALLAAATLLLGQQVQIQPSIGQGRLLPTGCANTDAPLYTSSTGLWTCTTTSGTGNVVRATSPTLTTPTLGVATITQVRGSGSATLGACGTGPSITGTDLGGDVTSGTGTTTCVVNFAATWTNQPFCVAEEVTTLAAVRISAISTSSFTVAGLTASDRFLYLCSGR